MSGPRHPDTEEVEREGELNTDGKIDTYTIRAVSQDDFVDVIIPTDETRIKFDDDDEPIPEQPKR